MFNIIDKIISFINRYIAAFGISAGVALAFGNVVVRYVFDGSLTWAAELTTYLFLWSTFFGAAYCFKHDAHISINILLEKVKPTTAKALMLLSHSITLIFLLAVSYYGYEYLLLVNELEETSVDLAIPMWIVYLVIPISFLFGAYRVSEKIIEVAKTPANEVLQHSEAEMIIAEMDEEQTDKLLKEVERKTGGML
ncbi:MAG: TRAP transporter small permease [Campylobacterota bacterium]|nr:TRAP transporter small permease [Campylobacterota bacterium]